MDVQARQPGVTRSGSEMKRKQPANARVLIVDDQRDIHDDFEEMLLARAAAADDLAASFLGAEEPDHHLPEFELLHAMGGEEACELVARAARDERPIAVAYIDIRMPPGIDGVTAVRRIRRVDRAIEIVLMTAYTETSLADIVQDMELLHKLLYIRKPFAREEVQQITLALVKKWNLERELEARRRQLTLTNRRLTAVLDSIGEAIAVSDDTHRLVFANRPYQRLMAATEAEMQAMTLEEADALWATRLRRVPLKDNGRDLMSEAGGELVEPLEPEPPAAGGSGSAGRLFYRQHRPVHDDRGAVIGDLYVYRDLSSEVEIEQMKAEVLSLRAALETPSSFAGIVGSSVPMQRVYGLMKRAMDAGVTVLIRGESGTGKELVAKALHANGPRRTGPFLAVNCAAVPESLIESELFGHEPGAFTGATRARVGVLRTGAGGDAPAGRYRRHEAGVAGQVAARPAGARAAAGGRNDHDTGGRSGDRGHQPGPGGGDASRRVPRRPVLPSGRVPDRDSAAAGAAGGPAAARRPLPAAARRAPRRAGEGRPPTRDEPVAGVRLARQRTRAARRDGARRSAGDR